MSLGYSNAAADRSFWDKLHLLKQILHFCGSQMLWIDITLMEFRFWLPATHATGPVYCLYWLGLQIVSSLLHIWNPLEKTKMDDYLVAPFQQWWSTVPIDWWLAEARRTPSVLLNQEECEVTLFQLHCVLLLSAQVIWHSRCQEMHLIILSLPITCAIRIYASYFEEMLNAQVQSPSVLILLCMEMWGKIVEKTSLPACFAVQTQ